MDSDSIKMHLFLDTCYEAENSCAEMYHLFAHQFTANRKISRLWSKTALEEENHACHDEWQGRTSMTSQPISPVRSVSKKFCFLAGLTLVLLPAAGLAETGDLLNIAATKSAVLALLATPANQRAREQNITDIVLARTNGLSVSVNCGASEPADSLREQVGLLTPVKTTVSLKNLSFKIGFAF